MRREAQIFPEIIERISVSMVNENAWRGVHNFPMQSQGFGFAGASIDEPRCIKFLSISVNGPVVAAEAIEYIGVNNSPEAVTEGNFAER